jgi:hypothetical protein
MAETGFNLTNAPQPTQTFAFGGLGGPSAGMPFAQPSWQSQASQSFLQSSPILTQGNQQAAPTAIQSAVDTIDTGTKAYDTFNNISNSSFLNNTVSQGVTSPTESVLEPGFYDKFGNIGDVTGLKGVGEGASFFDKITSFDPGAFGQSTTGIGGFVNDIGSAIGFGTPGSSVPGALGTTGTLSGVGTAATIGGFTGKYIGKFIGGNSAGASTGGAIGAGIGYAVGGPVGGVVGNVAGSVIGSFFGGGKPHPASAAMSLDIGADGTLNNVGIGSKHAGDEVGKKLSDDLQSYLKSQSKKYGVQYKNITGVRAAYDPGFYGTDGVVVVSTDPNFSKDRGLQGIKQSNDTTKVFNYSQNDKAARQKAYDDAFKFMVTSSGLDYDQVIAAKNTAAAGQQSAFNIRPTNEPSAFQQFLTNYREKQNANLA